MEKNGEVQPPITKGDRVHAFAGGRYRVLVVESVTSNAMLAQCSFTDRNTKHYVTCFLHGLATAHEQRPAAS